jgi:hypothetical protein
MIYIKQLEGYRGSLADLKKIVAVLIQLHGEETIIDLEAGNASAPTIIEDGDL